jgi:hypothetical protein
LEEVAVRAGQEVLMGVDDNILLIVGKPHGILDQQLSPHAAQLLNVIINFTLFYYIIVYFFKLGPYSHYFISS